MGAGVVGLWAAKAAFWDTDCAYPDHESGNAERPADCHVLVVEGAPHADVRWSLGRERAWRVDRQPDGRTYFASFPLRIQPLARIRARLETRPGIRSARHLWLDRAKEPLQKAAPVTPLWRALFALAAALFVGGFAWLALRVLRRGSGGRRR
ncbi:MAG: hypothetical protein F4089_11640 [Gammaproteobacteria bacterium]|nr:hypothetical protein [Gammaproteobacteria bacterium]